LSTPEATPVAVTQSPPGYQAEAVRRLYLGIEGAMPFIPLLPLVLVLGLWQHADKVWLLVWLAIAGAATPLWQYLVVRRYRAQSPEPVQGARWGRAIVLPTTVDGIVWGIAGIVFYSPDSLLQQLVLLALVVGIPAGSLFVTSWWPPVFYGNCYPLILLTAGGLAYRGSPEQLALSIGLVVYAVILHQLMKKAQAVAMETIALRFEKQDLIDQLQREKAVAERANLAKSKFLAAASHDLRQPLHAMTLFVAALDSYPQAPETRAMIGNVRRCTTALESLLQTLLDISKIDAGIVEPRIRSFSMAPLIQCLGTEFALQARPAGLALTTRCGDLTARSDPDLVERILRNLIVNAIRYTAAGSIEICCEASAAGIVVEVRDTGVGIPQDQHERVFEEFIQLGNPERDRTKGLGLGLAIVRRLADLLGIRVGLDSAPGKGSVFRLTLPVGDAATVVEAPPVLDASNAALAGSVVAVLDDEADVRDGMRILLEGWGCGVIAAEDAETIIAKFHACGLVPDIVLADYRLRGNTTGVDAIKTINDHFRTDIAAAIITGDTAPERLLEAQASGYILLHKPLRPAKLRALLVGLEQARGIDSPFPLTSSAPPALREQPDLRA
jgi:signal transduction histidine kinase/CheY-like chemotaxis protein